ncbi:EamA family transporter [Coprococcus sp. OM04-5BH]|uniref:EamA family transporter n=1 Tax=Coprococcus sp. OM04-5BH TaxID=2293093 RepID=UPI000E4C2072|nr:EamA family transporter [Coprococcus sp. OM04-5BH]RHV30283.1 EamA family transporter [Coprococcus sp. OM04-5BH]
MWILYAVGSSFFAGITSILAKIGIKKTDSNVATAVRTIVVLVFSWIMVLIVGSGNQVGNISTKTLVFLVLSGLATGASWLCYFRALQKGDINKVVPIDKSSTVLTILLALIFLGEGLSPVKIISVVLIAVGTLMMIDRKASTEADRDKDSRGWLIYAVLSAVFASVTAILGKVGIEDIDSNLGTAIRTTVVLLMAWFTVLVTGKCSEVKKIEGRELLFIILSGIATGASWLCYYRALKEGPASVVVPIDKLSILVTIVFSRIVFNERLNIKSGEGLVAIIAGTILLAVM